LVYVDAYLNISPLWGSWVQRISRSS